MITKTSVSTSATLVSAAKFRRWIMLENQSDSDIFVALEGSANVTIDSGAKPGIKIKANERFAITRDLGISPNEAIYAVSAAGSKVLVCHEGT